MKEKIHTLFMSFSSVSWALSNSFLFSASLAINLSNSFLDRINSDWRLLLISLAPENLFSTSLTSRFDSSNSRRQSFKSSCAISRVDSASPGRCPWRLEDPAISFSNSCFLFNKLSSKRLRNRWCLTLIFLEPES